MRPSRPTGVLLVAATECWERFSYYGMTAMLVLFLSAAVESGGVGWTRDQALRAYGLFGGAAFALPVVGGWLSDRALGLHRGVVLGGLAILVGNASLYVAGLVVGNGRTALALAGLAFVVIGTGLLKPAVSALVGRLYDAHPHLDRQAGYTLFMVGIWLGSIGGTIFSGAFGEMLGWRWGFLVSALGMAAGLGIYLVRSPRVILPVLAMPPIDGEGRAAVGERKGAGRAIACMTAFTAIYAIAFYQKAGVLTLMVRDATDREVGGVVLPAALFLTISTASFIAFAPLVQMIETRLRGRGVVIDLFAKQAAGLCLLMIGYLFFLGALGESARTAAGLHSPWWIVAGYLCFGLGDAMIWPPQIATISRIAPVRRVSLMIGLWYMTVGVGNYLAGALGPLAYRAGLHSYFLGIEAMLGIAVVLLLACRAFIPSLRCATDPRSVLELRR